MTKKSKSEKVSPFKLNGEVGRVRKDNKRDKKNVKVDIENYTYLKEMKEDYEKECPEKRFDYNDMITILIEQYGKSA